MNFLHTATKWKTDQTTQRSGTVGDESDGSDVKIIWTD